MSQHGYDEPGSTMKVPEVNLPPLSGSWRTFGLGTMLILVTVFSMWMAMAVWHPLLGVLGFFLFLPALVRTLIAIRIEQRQGHETSSSEKVNHLRVSVLMVGVAYMITVCVGFAFSLLGLGFFTLLDANIGGRYVNPGWGPYAELILALCTLLLGLGVLGWFTWLWFPRQKLMMQEEIVEDEIVEDVEIVSPT